MGLAVEILGLVIFLGAHWFVTMRDRRAALIAKIGEWPYRGLFSLVSDRRHRADRLWLCQLSRRRSDRRVDPPHWTRHIVEALMWPASIMFVAAYIPGNIKRVLKHPVLVSVKTWAFAHLCANGDLGGIILFGAVLAWAVYDRITLKHRSDPGAPPIPVGGGKNDIIAIIVGTIVYLALGFVFHPVVIGVPAFGSRHSTLACPCKTRSRRLTAPDIRARKAGEPIVCLTSYHAHTAGILDAYCDVILVGDSLGMVMHGLETTVPVTLDMMILQGLAVMRGSRRALVVVDMPFGSYEASREQAFMSAARILKETGCGAIKVEGGRRMAETIAFLVERGVPVMGHVGLTPQAINTIGSFRAQGRDEKDWAPIEADARAVADAGAFSVVLEAIAEPLGRRITEQVAIPTIGIGASVACDGQILVLEDMLGLSPRVPKFVKRFGELGPSIERAVKGYAEEVRARTFPGPDNVYGMRKK